MLQWSQNFWISTILSWQRWPFGWTNNGGKVWANAVLFLSGIMYRKVIHVNFFCFLFFCHICRTMHVCWDVEILLQRARVYIFQWPFLWSSYLEGVVVIQCMKRLRKGENICVLFENPTHCSIGSAGRRHKCKEDHGNYRCSSQSWSCVFNCNDLL